MQIHSRQGITPPIAIEEERLLLEAYAARGQEGILLGEIRDRHRGLGRESPAGVDRRDEGAHDRALTLDARAVTALSVDAFRVNVGLDVPP
jgi:hypothetical protein